MPNYLIDIEYDIREGVGFTTSANDDEQAEEFANEYVRETYPDAKNVEIVSIQELNI